MSFSMLLVEAVLLPFSVFVFVFVAFLFFSSLFSGMVPRKQKLKFLY